MYISNIINDYGKEYRPYMRGLVNHLPMTQLALYKMTNDINRVRDFTESYVKKAKIDPVKIEFEKINSIEECLGNRELYEPCLELINKELEEKNIDEVISYVLNTYPLGMSSGLFHTLIRVAYAVEGYRIDRDLIQEVTRALAYYITAYREAKPFSRDIKAKDILKEMEGLVSNPHINDVLKTQNTMGQKIKALYNDEEYLNLGFRLRGTEDEKIRALLSIVLPAYINSDDIVVLHCITGIHALIVLKEYYNDFDKAIDILTSCFISHLLTLENIDYTNGKDRIVDLSWGNIISMAVESPDVHTIKLTYSCRELCNLYKMVELRTATKKRVMNK